MGVTVRREDDDCLGGERDASSLRARRRARRLRLGERGGVEAREDELKRRLERRRAGEEQIDELLDDDREEAEDEDKDEEDELDDADFDCECRVVCFLQLRPRPSRLTAGLAERDEVELVEEAADDDRGRSECLDDSDEREDRLELEADDCEDAADELDKRLLRPNLLARFLTLSFRCDSLRLALFRRDVGAQEEDDEDDENEE